MEVTIKHWLTSKEIWLNVASIVSGLATLALSQLSMLGLSPGKMFWWSLALTFLVNVANIVLRLKSTSVIGTKAEVKAAVQDGVEVTVRSGR